MNEKGTKFDLQLVERLRKYGLSETEAKVYISLLILRKASASKISKYLNMERTQVYRGLSSLYNKGIIEIEIGEPQKFKPVEPEISLDILISKMENRIEELRNEARRLSEELKLFNIKAYKVDDNTSYEYKLKMGRRNFLEDIKKSVELASNSILRIQTPNALKRTEIYGLITPYEMASRRGVNVEIISEINSENLIQAKKFLKFSKLFYLPEIFMSVQIIDERLTILCTNYEDHTSSLNANDIYIISEDPTFSKAFVTVFKHLKSNSIPAESIIEKIEKRGKLNVVG